MNAPTEARRGCGFRKIGGKYLIGGRDGINCFRFPLPLDVCPTCHSGIKVTRGWTWVRPEALFAGSGCAGINVCARCPLQDLSVLADAKGRCGLLWVGEKFYATPEAFMAEVREQGISRRVPTVPKGAKPGVTWVLLAHRKAVPTMIDHGTIVHRPGVFMAFRLTAIEACISEMDAADDQKVARLKARGLTPVALPECPEHRGRGTGHQQRPLVPGYHDQQVDAFL